MEARLIRTGEVVPFTQIRCGAPFFYHGRFWTRTDRWSATDIGIGGPDSYGACSFTHVKGNPDEATDSHSDYFLERSDSPDVEVVRLEIAA